MKSGEKNLKQTKWNISLILQIVTILILLSASINVNVVGEVNKSKIQKVVEDSKECTVPTTKVNDMVNLDAKVIVGCQITNTTCVDPSEIEHYDLTEGATSNWHITNSGFDNYLWCGEESTGVYGSNWNDALYLAPTGEKSMDWSSDSHSVTFSFDSYEDFQGSPYDYGFIEVNPHVSESDSYWYTYFSDFGQHRPYWTTYEFEFTPTMFYNNLIGDNLFNQEGGYTDDMGLRFRFKSDGSMECKGWLLDNIKINDSSGYLYELNPCNNMEHFIAGNINSGNWWSENILFDGWTCMDQIACVIPNDVNNSLEISLPSGIYDELTFYHDYNLEFYGDFCYLEISTNGGSTWTCPLRFTGSNARIEIIDMTVFTGNNVIIRWRIKTNSTGFSSYYSFRDICVTGEIDSESPLTTGILSGTRLRGWYSSPVTFTATATDDISGVAATYYKIDGGPTLIYYGPTTIRTNGEHNIEYWSVDKVGNEEVHHVTETFKIDTEAPPIVTLSAPESGLYLFGKKLFSTSKIIIVGGFTFEAIAKDMHSGIYRVKFLLDDVEFYKSTRAPYIAYCSERHMGSGTIKVIAEDFAGNTAQDTLHTYYNKFL